MCYRHSKRIRAATIKALNNIKERIPVYSGITLNCNCFITGRLTVLRRSLKDILEHAAEDEAICVWLQTFQLKSLKRMRYKGWAQNRPYPERHPRYDPNNPSQSKHNTDTYYFLYYTMKIEKWNYWVNVKMHRDYGEVIYTIKRNKPSDLIKGHKKK